jgi:1-deoxy-D-xylulose-5-phosphate reductoisomerase
VAGLDLLAQGRLDFEAPDTDAFPCLRLAWQALEAGGSAPAVLNAANEVAVSAFLQGRIGFLAIPALVEETLARLPASPAESLEALLATDAQARRLTEHAVSQLAQSQGHRLPA